MPSVVESRVIFISSVEVLIEIGLFQPASIMLFHGLAPVSSDNEWTGGYELFPKKKYYVRLGFLGLKMCSL